MEPLLGIFDDAMVADFKSMYHTMSASLSWNHAHALHGWNKSNWREAWGLAA